MNILILSVGTRNKVVEYIKKGLGSSDRLICTDHSPYAPALYEGDGFYLTPHITDPIYIDDIINICEKENIDAVLSLIDPELKVLAENETLFKEKGIMLLQSSLEVIDKSFNKYAFYQEVSKRGFISQKSYVDYSILKEDIKNNRIGFPLFAKPNSGSASLDINKVLDIETLNTLIKGKESLIVQEYISGKEYGVDVYVDYISKEVISIFIKQKLKMRAGETDKSISIKNEKLFKLIERFVISMGYVGQLDIDVFEKEGTYYISEVNPRFGGGFPHAYEAGCDFPSYIIKNVRGEINKPEIGNYKEGTLMMKYSEVKFID